MKTEKHDARKEFMESDLLTFEEKIAAYCTRQLLHIYKDLGINSVMKSILVSTLLENSIDCLRADAIANFEYSIEENDEDDDETDYSDED